MNSSTLNLINATGCALMLFMACMAVYSIQEYHERKSLLIDGFGWSPEFDRCRTQLPFLIRATAIAQETLDIRNDTNVWCAQSYAVFRSAFEESRSYAHDTRRKPQSWRVRLFADSFYPVCDQFVGGLYRNPPTGVRVKYHSYPGVPWWESGTEPLDVELIAY